MSRNLLPHGDVVGFVDEVINPLTGIGFVAIYDREKGFDADADYRYVIVCEQHNTMTSASSKKLAKEIMGAVDFCEECQHAQPLAIRQHGEFL